VFSFLTFKLQDHDGVRVGEMLDYADMGMCEGFDGIVSGHSGSMAGLY
jgi:hypothetical protein